MGGFLAACKPAKPNPIPRAEIGVDLATARFCRLATTRIPSRANTVQVNHAMHLGEAPAAALGVPPCAVFIITA
jgi:hypothetical protein